jgi:hypothetical protein
MPSLPVRQRLSFRTPVLSNRSVPCRLSQARYRSRSLSVILRVSVITRVIRACFRRRAGDERVREQISTLVRRRPPDLTNREQPDSAVPRKIHFLAAILIAIRLVSIAFHPLTSPRSTPPAPIPKPQLRSLPDPSSMPNSRPQSRPQRDPSNEVAGSLDRLREPASAEELNDVASSSRSRASPIARRVFSEHLPQSGVELKIPPFERPGQPDQVRLLYGENDSMENRSAFTFEVSTVARLPLLEMFPPIDALDDFTFAPPIPLALDAPRG